MRIVVVLSALAGATLAGCPESPSRPTERSEPSAPVALPSPGPPPTRPPVPVVATLVGAGDIGVCGRTAPEETARLLDNIPGTIFTTGDNAYPSGTDQQFRDCYGPTWGRHRQRTRPTPGNHDYESPGAGPYFSYFGANAGPPGLGYYTYRLGDWEIYALNSNIVADDRSAQYAWLAGELLQRASRCSLAYWHHPVVSEGPYGDGRHMRAIWKLLYQHGVDVVITGHDHNYQRFAPLDGDLRRSPTAGVRQFVVGNGRRRALRVPRRRRQHRSPGRHLRGSQAHARERPLRLGLPRRRGTGVPRRRQRQLQVTSTSRRAVSSAIPEQSPA